MGKTIKYLGAADRRRISKGENFNGQLAEELSKDVEWNHDNHFMVDSDEAGLSGEALELLLTDEDFRDVTDLKTYPLSRAEQFRMGAQRVSAENVATPGEDEDSETSTSSTTKKATKKTASATSGGATTTGGSTTSDAS